MKFPLIPQVQSALCLLEESGFEAYLVGGCVRDFLLGHSPGDYDMTTNATPVEIKAVFASYRLVETGIQHGTVTILIDGVPLELTTYRIDGGYLDARHPNEVRFTNSLREDAARRDFTINAMAYHPQEGIIDFFGGCSDLREKRIRCVGAADTRFQEDALRMLRALRFSAVLGFTLEAETKAAVFRNRALISHVSVERITMELRKLLCGRHVAQVLETYVDVLGICIPELLSLREGSCSEESLLHETANALERVPPIFSLRLTILLHAIEQKKESFDEKTLLHRLHLDRVTREKVRTLLQFFDIEFLESRCSVRRWMSRLSPNIYFELLQLRRAWNPRQSKQEEAVEQLARGLLQKEGCLTLRTLALQGKDLIELGMDGPEIGKTLNFLLDAVLDEAVANKPEELLQYLKKKKK